MDSAIDYGKYNMGISQDALAHSRLQRILEQVRIEPYSLRIAKATYTEDCLPDTRIIARQGRKAMIQFLARVMTPAPQTPLVAPPEPVPEPAKGRVGRPSITEIVRKLVPTANHKYIALDDSGTVVMVFTGRKGLSDAGYHYQTLLANTKLGRKYKGFHWRAKKIWEFRLVKQRIED